MGLLADWQIRELVKITPFSEGVKRPGVISYGLSSYGYDVRVGYKFKVFTPIHCGVVDPKNFDPRSFVDVDLDPANIKRHLLTENRLHDTPYTVCCVCGKHWSKDVAFMAEKERCGLPPPDHILIPPNSFVLAETLEHLEIPRDYLCIVVGKSTYARTGIIVNVTPLEPEWRGKITMEISNTAPLPAKVYTGEGLAQILFLSADAECEQSYADKQGVYQDQTGLTLPRLRKEV